MSRTLVFNDRNGRFGNKLFQIAATIATAKKNNLSYGTNFDLNVNHIFKNNPLSVAALPEKTYNQQQWNYYDIILDKSIDMHGVDIVQGAGDIKHDGYNETIVVYGFRLEKV
jgi:hypothetical protein